MDVDLYFLVIDINTFVSFPVLSHHVVSVLIFLVTELVMVIFSYYYSFLLSFIYVLFILLLKILLSLFKSV